MNFKTLLFFLFILLPLQSQINYREGLRYYTRSETYNLLISLHMAPNIALFNMKEAVLDGNTLEQQYFNREWHYGLDFTVRSSDEKSLFRSLRTTYTPVHYGVKNTIISNTHYREQYKHNNISLSYLFQYKPIFLFHNPMSTWSYARYIFGIGPALSLSKWEHQVFVNHATAKDEGLARSQVNRLFPGFQTQMGFALGLERFPFETGFILSYELYLGDPYQAVTLEPDQLLKHFLSRQQYFSLFFFFGRYI